LKGSSIKLVRIKFSLEGEVEAEFIEVVSRSTNRIEVQVQVDRIRSDVPNDELKSNTQVRSEVE
jgi:hypothetical protein